MRILITGGAGQVATDLASHCEAVGDDVVAMTRTQLDISDRDAVHQAIGSVHPDVVVNAAAWTAVDECESDPQRAYRANAMAVRWLAEATERARGHLIQISTDYVFDGTKADPYHEWDRPNPQSVYGASKLAGETEGLRHCSSVTVARTAWVMGAHGSNMLKTVVGLRDRSELAFVDDQRGCPTFTAALAVALRQAAGARLPGVFHLTNQGAVSWYEFVCEVLARLGEDPGKVKPIATSKLDPSRPAPRPANSVLANTAWGGAGYDQIGRAHV